MPECWCLLLVSVRRKIIGMWPESRNALDILPLPIPRLVVFTRTLSGRSFDLLHEMGTWRSGFTSGKFISSCRKCYSRIFTVSCIVDASAATSKYRRKMRRRTSRKAQKNPCCRSKEFSFESYTNVSHTIDNNMFSIISVHKWKGLLKGNIFGGLTWSNNKIYHCRKRCWCLVGTSVNDKRKKEDGRDEWMKTNRNESV